MNVGEDLELRLGARGRLTGVEVPEQVLQRLDGRGVNRVGRVEVLQSATTTEAVCVPHIKPSEVDGDIARHVGDDGDEVVGDKRTLCGPAAAAVLGHPASPTHV